MVSIGTAVFAQSPWLSRFVYSLRCSVASLLSDTAPARKLVKEMGIYSPGTRHVEEGCITSQSHSFSPENWTATHLYKITITYCHRLDQPEKLLFFAAYRPSCGYMNKKLRAQR